MRTPGGSEFEPIIDLGPVAKGYFSPPAFSPDGSTVYAVLNDSSLNLWSLALHLWPAWLGLLTLAAVLALASRRLRVWRTPQQRGRWHCRRCNYDLGPGGTPPTMAKCSECGVDLARKPALPGRGWARRARWSLSAVALLVALCVMALIVRPERMPEVRRWFWWGAPELEAWLDAKRPRWRAEVGLDREWAGLLYAFDVKSGSRRLVAITDYSFEAPVLSRDGSVIALQTMVANAGVNVRASGLTMLSKSGRTLLCGPPGLSTRWTISSRISLAPDGSWARFVAIDNSRWAVLQVDGDSGECQVVTQGPFDSSFGQYFRPILMSEDGATVLIQPGVYGRDIEVHHLTSGQTTSLPNVVSGYAALQVSRDGRVVASRSGFGTITLWDTISGEPLPAPDEPRSIPGYARLGHLSSFQIEQAARRLAGQPLLPDGVYARTRDDGARFDGGDVAISPNGDYVAVNPILITDRKPPARFLSNDYRVYAVKPLPPPAAPPASPNPR